MLVSAITVAELYVGSRGRSALRWMGSCRSFTCAGRPGGRDLGWSPAPDFGPKHGVGLSDALIAATAFQEKATLVTLNGKHFPMLSDVLAPYRKP